MSLIRKLRDRLQGATLHDLWVETRWVLHHSKRYRRSIAAYVLLGIASIALSLLSSLSSRELINAIVYLKGGGRRVLFCGITVVLLAGSTIVLNALVSRFSAKINLRVGNELRAEVFGSGLQTDLVSIPDPAADPYSTVHTASAALRQKLPDTQMIALLDSDSLEARIQGAGENGIERYIVDSPALS